MRQWLVLAAVALAAWPQVPAAQSLALPVARRDSVLDTYHGVRVSDPYRWLEAADSPDTRDFGQAEVRLADAYLGSIPQREAFRRRLTALWEYSRTDVPWREAGELFFTENSGHQPQPVLYVLDSVGGTPRTVLDPQEISPDGSTAAGNYAVSPDGRWLAYSQARGGAVNVEMRVRDLATGREQGDVVRGAWGACWTLDGGGFFYARAAPNVGKGRPPPASRSSCATTCWANRRNGTARPSSPRGWAWAARGADSSGFLHARVATFLRRSFVGRNLQRLVACAHRCGVCAPPSRPASGPAVGGGSILGVID